MRTVAERLRRHLWRRLSGAGVPPLEVLKHTEWSTEFERYMRNRLIMGALRYGLLHDKERAGYDYVGSIQQRAVAYLEDGNQEHLVDIANCALLEFVRKCCHPNPRFRAEDDNKSLHVQKKS